MAQQPSERAFEDAIEAALLKGGPDAPGSPPEGGGRGAGNMGDPAPAYGEGSAFESGHYLKRVTEAYDRTRCMLPDDVLSFIYATQPKEWEKFSKQHGPDARERLLGRLASEVAKRGTVEILRKGIKCDGCRFALAHFRPASGLNPELQRLHDANMFSVVRQLHYSARSESSVDLGIFLNGLPIFTAELKCQGSGKLVHSGSGETGPFLSLGL